MLHVTMKSEGAANRGAGPENACGTVGAVSAEHENGWLRMIREKPGHSQWYINRFRSMAADGADLAGEARMLDAMVSRGARVLDAGCGTGRVGSFLAAAGHTVVGVDLDPELIAAAEREYPAATWLVGDLAELDLPARGITEPFDAVVCAGNVMTFLAPATRREVLVRLRRHVRPDGRVVIGFGAGRGYDFGTFLADATHAGLVEDLLLSSWELRPFTAGSDFLVAILRPA
jgi:SAM-dependent methyltransferase